MISARRALPSYCVALLLALSAGFPAAAQQVTLERDSPLYAEPRLEAAPVAQLARGAAGEVIGKQGGWLNLRTPAGNGWLFSFNVRFPVQKSAEGESGAGPALGQVFGPRRSPAVTSTIGIRGLEEEDLRKAGYDAAQMKLLDGYAVSKPAAEEGARTEGLVPARVEYLEPNR